jgi:PAS domain S-box-containing protein
MQNASTTHKHIERTLRYLSIVADMAAEKANEGIAVADLDGSLLFLNEAWCGMHGYKSKDELIGKQLSIFHTKEQMKTDVIPLLEKTKQCGQTEGTIGHIKSNGTVFVTQTEMISVGDGAGKAAGFIVFAANNVQSLKLKDTTVDNLKQIKHLSERIAQFRKLFCEFRQIGECLAEQTNELRANNEMLLKQISELDQSALIPKQNLEQISPRKNQGIIISKRPVDVNPERQQPKEALTKSFKTMVKSKRSNKKFDAKDFEKLAELARRLSDFSNYNIQSDRKDMASESERCSIKTENAMSNKI